MHLLNKDKDTCNIVSNDYMEIEKAADDFFKNMNYTTSSFTETIKRKEGKVFAFHSQEDSSADHFYGFLIDE